MGERLGIEGDQIKFMSNNQNTKLEEELADLEEEVMDSLKSFRQADKDLDEAMRWKGLTRMRLEEDEKRLSDFNKRMGRYE